MLFNEDELELRHVIELALKKRGSKNFISESYKIDKTSNVYYGVVKIGGRYYTAQNKSREDLIKQLIKELK